MPIPGAMSPIDLMTSSRGTPLSQALVTTAQPWVAETFPLLTQSAATAVTSQKIHATAIGLVAGQIINNVLVANTTAAVGTLPTSVTVGLASADGKVVAKSTADLTQLASWGVGINAYALSAAYTVPSSGLYYVLFLQNGTFGTTQPTVVNKTLTATLGNVHFLFGSFGTGQTSIPAVGSSAGTFTANETVAFWFGVS